MSFAQELERQIYILEAFLPKWMHGEAVKKKRSRWRIGRSNGPIALADVVVLRRIDGTEVIMKNRYGPVSK